MIILLLFLIGICIGSFLNVVIYRLPNEGSIIYPSSRCPVCGHRLAWYELIPLISYLLQWGKCRECREKIAITYPLVELVTGFIYLFLWRHYGISINLLSALVFVTVLIPIVIIDFKHQIIPDQINIVGAILGGLLLPSSLISFVDAAIGVVGGALIMLLIAIVSRGGMGGGDIKMVAMMGIFLGWKMILVALFLSFIIAGLGSGLLIILGIKKRKDFIPFGPFLAIGGFTAYVFGTKILTWYLATLL